MFYVLYKNYIWIVKKIVWDKLLNMHFQNSFFKNDFIETKKIVKFCTKFKSNFLMNM